MTTDTLKAVIVFFFFNARAQSVA